MKKLPFFNKLSFLPVLVLTILVVVFSYISYFVHNEIRNDFDDQEDVAFELEVKQLTSSTEQLFSEYSKILLSTRALFNASEVVERSEWHTFIESLELEEHFSSVFRITYVQRVSAVDTNNYINTIRNDTFFSKEGFIDFSIFPQNSNEEHYVVQFVEPVQGSHDLYGFDLSSDENRLAALELSRDTNNIVMTNPLILNTGETDSKSFLLFLPVYKNGVPIETLDQRRDNLQGFIALSTQGDDFIQHILSSNSLSYITSLKINDVTKNLELFLPETEILKIDDDVDRELHKKVTRRNFASRTWELVFYSNHLRELSEVGQLLPFFILFIGFLVSGLVAYFLFNFASSKTEAENTANSLTKDLRKYQLAVQNISEQIVITDAEGIILFANPAAERITGFRVDEVMGTKAGKKWGGLMPKEFYKELWDVIKVRKQTYIGELKNKRKNGENYMAEIRISPIKNKAGNVEFFVASERDLTNEKKIDQIKNQFIALASHQLRTPLSSMKWNMEMLIKGEVGKLMPEQLELSRNLYESVQRMITLVNSLLNVSRIESGKLMIDPKPTNIVALATEIINEVKAAAVKKNIHIETNFSPNLTEISVDRTLVKEVYRNLLTNALKYTKNDGLIKLNITQMGQYITSELIDNGIGIPGKDQNSVFNKFHRGSNVLKADTDGNGLGLYMTKTIVETSNGKIWFDSTEGKGTTFWFSLPITDIVAKKGTEAINNSEPSVELHSQEVN